MSISGASRLPPSISSAFQIAEPAKVKTRKRHRLMCASPAGSETMVRRNGEKRSTKTTHWPCAEEAGGLFDIFEVDGEPAAPSLDERPSRS